jgi:hypothetical protein
MQQMYAQYRVGMQDTVDRNANYLKRGRLRGMQLLSRLLGPLGFRSAAVS